MHSRSKVHHDLVFLLWRDSILDEHFLIVERMQLKYISLTSAGLPTVLTSNFQMIKAAARFNSSQAARASAEFGIFGRRNNNASSIRVRCH